MGTPAKDETPKQLTCEDDRSRLREYLTKRLATLKKEHRLTMRNGGEAAEDGFYEGSEMEIVFAFDDLLGEQPPDLQKKSRSH